MKEEKKASLEQRRNRLRAMLQEEQDRLEAELGELVPDRSTVASQLVQKTDELRTAREERRKKVGYFSVSTASRCSTVSSQHLFPLSFSFCSQLAQELLREHWKKNNPELREVAQFKLFMQKWQVAKSLTSKPDCWWSDKWASGILWPSCASKELRKERKQTLFVKTSLDLETNRACDADIPWLFC